MDAIQSAWGFIQWIWNQVVYGKANSINQGGKI
jgi:hypothetical protein